MSGFRFDEREESTHSDDHACQIREHDRLYHADHAGKFVIKKIDEKIQPLFETEEIAIIFDVNSSMLENHMAEYLRQVFGERSGSINHLYVRRGVCIPHKPEDHLTELHYINSYSLASGPVELFAQTQGRCLCDSLPCIFSAPVPAVQERVVAFAPFIDGMQLDQMEFVIAPLCAPLLSSTTVSTALLQRELGNIASRDLSRSLRLITPPRPKRKFA